MPARSSCSASTVVRSVEVNPIIRVNYSTQNDRSIAVGVDYIAAQYHPDRIASFNLVVLVIVASLTEQS